MDFLNAPFSFFARLTCQFISAIISFFPSTPDGLTLAGLSSRMANTIPFIGSGIIYHFLRDVSGILTLVVVIKIYKLIPFKMS